MARRVTVVGLSSGLFNTAQQLASIGLAVLASGYGRGFLGAAICVLAALALAAILLPRPPSVLAVQPRPGERTVYGCAMAEALGSGWR